MAFLIILRRLFKQQEKGSQPDMERWARCAYGPETFFENPVWFPFLMFCFETYICDQIVMPSWHPLANDAPRKTVVYNLSLCILQQHLSNLQSADEAVTDRPLTLNCHASWHAHLGDEHAKIDSKFKSPYRSSTGWSKLHWELSLKQTQCSKLI